MDNRQGTVFWVTGLSGSGKTTVGQLLANGLRERSLPVVLLDGDVLREIFGGRFGHGPADRMDAARHYSRLCQHLARQGINVVCATISMFPEIQQWNRTQIKGYREIYLRVPLAELQRRDSKGLYAKAARGEIADIVGVHIEAQEPQCPDLIIESYGAVSPQAAADEIIANWEASQREKHGTA